MNKSQISFQCFDHRFRNGNRIHSLSFQRTAEGYSALRAEFMFVASRNFDPIRRNFRRRRRKAGIGDDVDLRFLRAHRLGCLLILLFLISQIFFFSLGSVSDVDHAFMLLGVGEANQ